MPARMITALIALMLAAGAAHAGKLGAFESELKNSGSKKKSKRGSAAFDVLSTESGSSSGLRDEDCDPLMLCLILLSIEYGAVPTFEYAPKRERGQPTIPILRVDSSYQRVVGNIDAYSTRAELGWAIFGVAYEYTQFREHDPPDRLGTWYWEGIWRTAPSKHLRFDWTLGYRGLTRDERHGGAQVGFSLGVYANKNLGAEGDFRWGSISDLTLSDYRGRLVLSIPRLKYLSLRAGYRAIRVGDASLHGPEAGLTLIW